jgi:hypothetical protein
MNQTTQGLTDVSLDAARVLQRDELTEISGGAPCSYLGVEDWRLLMSYETRNYCC